MTHGNGTIAETDYDDAGRITAVRNLKSDGSTVLSIFTYSYDDAGNRTGVAEANGDRVTWSYDESNQLTSEARSGGNGYGLQYTYDAVGNRLTQFNGAATTTYSYDEANQLTVEENPSARITYSYDANGNSEVVNDDGSLTTHSWDIENCMTLAELPGGGRNTITYDGDGKRRSLEDSAMLRNFVWDMENILLQTGSDNATNRRYTLRPEIYGELISQDGPTFHHYDALGSTMQLSDADQDEVISYLYRAFGEQTVLSGSDPNRFTWLGRWGYYWQPDTDEYWVRARVYRPQIGRFVSRVRLPNTAAMGRITYQELREVWGVKIGPLGMLEAFGPKHTHEHPYGYGENSPVNYVDPSGLMSEKACKWLCISACAVGGGALCSLCGVLGPAAAPCLAGCALAAGLECGSWCANICDPCR